MESVVESKDLLYWVLDKLNEIKKSNLTKEQINTMFPFSKCFAALDTVKGTFQKDTTVNKYLNDATDHIQKFKEAWKPIDEVWKHVTEAWKNIDDTISYLDKNYNYIINNIPNQIPLGKKWEQSFDFYWAPLHTNMLSPEKQKLWSRDAFDDYVKNVLKIPFPENLSSYEQMEFSFEQVSDILQKYFANICSWKSLTFQECWVIDRIKQINGIKDLSRLNQFILDNIVPNIMNLIWNKDIAISKSSKWEIIRFLVKIWEIWNCIWYNKNNAQEYFIAFHKQAYVPQQPGNFQPGKEIPAKILMEGIMLMDSQQLPEITPDNLRDPYVVYGVNEWLYEWYAFDPDEWSVVSVTKTKDSQWNDIYTRLKKENGWTESATYVYSRTRDQNWRSIWTKTRLDS